MDKVEAVGSQPQQNRYGELIHLLNQRYHAQWVRAEALQSELTRIQRSIFWPCYSCLRTMKRWVNNWVRSAGPVLAAKSLPYQAPAQCQFKPTTISIIIPFRDRLELLQNCLRSLKTSSYRRFEIILVNNASSDQSMGRYLARMKTRRNVQVIDVPGSFHFARLCNAGASRARGRQLLFLNNDTEVLAKDWLEQLLRLTSDRLVGIAGATLLYPDRTIQHAGLFPRTDGLWIHPYQGHPEWEAGDRGELHTVRTVPAVTAACLLIRKKLFQALGGFDERFPVAYNDVDLCRRVREQGLLVVISPHARLLHYEGLSRGYTVDRPEPVG